MLAVFLGIGIWLAGLNMNWGSAFPAQLAGVLSAFAGMVLGSLAPQWIRDQKTDVEPFVPDNSVRAAAGR